MPDGNAGGKERGEIMKEKNRPARRVLRAVACHALTLGAMLVAFALYHHVLPAAGAGLGRTTTAATTASVTAPPAVISMEETPEEPSEEPSEEPFEGIPETDAATYRSDALSISIEKKTFGSGGDTVTCYVADVYIADITCLQTVFAQDTYGTGFTESVLSMDARSGAVLALTGDYYGNSRSGVVIRNGVIYRAADTSSDVCVLYADGRMAIVSGRGFDVEQVVADGAYQAWTFGPSLLDDSGAAITSFQTGRHMNGKNPRTAIGYYAPGHYALVVVDGRDEGYSEGLTLSGLARLMEDLGCSLAYNLDGGKSAIMTYDDAFVNQPASGGRELSDCIILKEVDAL